MSDAMIKELRGAVSRPDRRRQVAGRQRPPSRWHVVGPRPGHQAVSVIRQGQLHVKLVEHGGTQSGKGGAGHARRGLAQKSGGAEGGAETVNAKRTGVEGLGNKCNEM